MRGNLIAVSFFRVLAVCTASLYSGLLCAETVRVAIASNFMAPMKLIEEAFEKQSEFDLSVSYASSGKLYAQIKHGAPYHVFLSADQEKPFALINDGLAEKSTLFTYALGALALVTGKHVNDNNAPVTARDFDNTSATHISNSPEWSAADLTKVVVGLKAVAIANPQLAPYGRASEKVLDSLVQKPFGFKLVMGESVTQAFQFVYSGNVDAAFVAYSQVSQTDTSRFGDIWRIPADWHQSIRQDAVLLKQGKNKKGALAFLAFLKSEKAQEIITAFGYGVALN